MIVFPNSKINLGLQITGKRPDGFHSLQTLFYPLSLCDILEIIPSPSGKDSFTLSGLPIPDYDGMNICEKARDMVRKNHTFPPVFIHLHKVVPIGSGLGGGSADGAFTLKLLNDIFTLGIPKEELSSMAALLGSDCAFFLENRPCLASGRGELLQPHELNLAGWHLMVVMPPIHVSTREAFAGIRPKNPETSLSNILKAPVDKWNGLLKNDFEQGIFRKFPVIRDIKEHFYKLGASYASMSGSGAAVFGIFESPPHQSKWQQYFSNYFVWQEKMA